MRGGGFVRFDTTDCLPLYGKERMNSPSSDELPDGSPLSAVLGLGAKFCLEGPTIIVGMMI